MSTPEMHHITAALLDKVINRFWQEAATFGPGELAMAEALQFGEIVAGSREFELFITGSARTILAGADRHQLSTSRRQNLEDVTRGVLIAAFQMGVQVGLEACRERAAKH